ncbi:gliding motility-associated C-terminal domain-containing protein [Paracrocinitomix mangrovi]|uniref:T9SS type B sorting domain-containing protein n=1 Tax=Paracrocinitomix mangrovi TaxID=2862509 RepID=UPI001C8E92E8|nr:gliding motility-associated C-terminal domain-containing protein [Paracrocinitomix mangrovi]UKN00559.1 gliding motility-associated C-terminal domain-containing protein [Paracrocinitomix mangrovi]
MKEDINIEELFKQKFENFEANVDPSVWANVSQSIGRGAAGSGAAAGGISAFTKVAIIVGAAAVTTFSVWYFNDTTESDQIVNQPNITEKIDKNTVVNTEENIQPTIDNSAEQSNVVEENDQLNEINVESNDHNENTETSISVDINEGNEGSTTFDFSQGTGQGVGGNGENTFGNNEGDKEVKNPNEENESGKIVETEKPKVTYNPTFKVNGNTVSFDANAENHSSVSWRLGDGSIKEGDQLEYTYKKPGVYTVMVEIKEDQDKKGNLYPLIVEIKGVSEISQIPNVITPNGDNDNDFFYIEMKEIEVFSIQIFNKVGKVIFETNDPNFKWYGELPDGSKEAGRYYYNINAVGTDGSIIPRTGEFNVIL